MFMKRYLKWEETDFTWETLFMVWEDVAIIDELIKKLRGGGGSYWDYMKGNPWEKNAKLIGEELNKKFIKIYCKVNGIDYKEEKPNKRIKATINGLHRVLNYNESMKKVILKSKI